MGSNDTDFSIHTEMIFIIWYLNAWEVSDKMRLEITVSAKAIAKDSTNYLSHRLFLEISLYLYNRRGYLELSGFVWFILI